MPLTIPKCLSLYIHLPWCIKKCPYCDFNSHPLNGELDEHRYVTALLNDLSIEINHLNESKTLSSIFIGGGTPSLFSSSQIKRLLDGVCQLIDINSGIEITLEANPDASDQKRFDDFSQAGVNRLSIGIQSFNSTHLSALGRTHDSKQAINAVKAAKQAGFKNFNLDLMYSLPQQTPDTALEDIHQAIDLTPTHISAYQLTIEPNTLFSLHAPTLPEDEIQWEIQNQYWTQLQQAGYQQYEISAYAKQNQQCQHNTNYWRFGDYIGIGAGAHGKFSTSEGIVRSHKPKHPLTYMRKMCVEAPSINEYRRMVKPADLPLEFMMNQLRLNESFALSDFENRTGLDKGILDNPIARAKSMGLLLIDNDRLTINPSGRLFLDDVLQLFMFK